MRRWYCILTISFLAFLLAHPAPAKVIYVSQDATGHGSGSSWANACTSITAGLTASASGNEIWVKSATYPEAILMKEGVALYGGFPVDGSPSFDQREWTSNETIIDATGLNTHVVVGADFAAIDGFTITGGSAENGGGVYCNGSSPTLVHCAITKNEARGDDPGGLGGGMYCHRSFPRVDHCRISDNHSKRGGGGVACVELSSPLLTNCLITGNQDNHYRAGGVYSLDSSPILINCTIAGNHGDRAIDGVNVRGDYYPTLTNCILWNDGLDLGLYKYSGTVTYCCLKDSWPGEGNFGADPLFVSPETGDYRLQNGSPCIDRGLASAAPDHDIDGNPRPGADGKVDIGAYESSPEYEPAPPTIRHVRADASEGGDGLSWDTAYRSIQEGLDAAQPLDEVWVAGGIYREVVEFVADVPLYGGFAGHETEREQRDWAANATVIDSVPGSEALLWLYGVDQSVIDGFTIKGNFECRGSWPTLANCTITTDSLGRGGTVYIGQSGGVAFPTLIDCKISGSPHSGVNCSYSYATLIGCTISGCSWGVFVKGRSVTLTNCTIKDNLNDGIFLSQRGRVIATGCKIIDNIDHGVQAWPSCPSSFPTFTNCLISGNGGYGVFADRASPIFNNCTIAHNGLGGVYTLQCHFTPLDGDPFWQCGGELPVLINCILWNSNPVDVLWEYYEEQWGEYYEPLYELVGTESPPLGEGLDLTYSCVVGGWPDVGNVDTDPLFVDRPNGDYRLLAGSPCIDQGSNDAAGEILFDLAGNPRILDGDAVPGAVVDLGAYEFDPANPPPTPTPTVTPTPTDTPVPPTSTPTPIPPQLWLLDAHGQVHHLPAPTP